MRRILVSLIVVASVLITSTALAAMDKGAHDKFVGRCKASMYMSGAQCSCMADIASRKLDALAIAYLSLDPLDVRHSAAMSKKMTGKELASIDSFMKTAPHACKGAK
jgi:hypothetical protein